MAKIEKRDNSPENKILTGMIVSKTVLGKLSPRWTDDGLFKSTWANLVGRWCIDYYKDYGKAPGRGIQSLFGDWAESGDEDTVRLVEKFLTALNDDYTVQKKINPDYIVDMAGEHFNRIATIRLKEAIEAELDGGKVSRAIDRIQTFGKIEVAGSSVIKLFNDKDAQKDTFAEPPESIVRYPDDLGEFFGSSLGRDMLIGFMAPEKRGKTFWLIDMAFRAVSQRRRTLFFEIGDLSERQLKRRFLSRVSKRPFVKPRKPIQYPERITKGDEGVEAVHKLLEFDSGLNFKLAWKASQRFNRQMVKSGKDYLRMSIHPNNSITIGGIEAIVKQQIREGWIPDVIVIDYADLLSPMNGAADSRDAINTNWKHMRGMSQRYHCLLMTATQAKATAYTANLMDMKDFSEDKRKFAHVNGMLGINQNEQEKLQGLQRLNWIALREEEYYISDTIYVAGCLSIVNPAILSLY